MFLPPTYHEVPQSNSEVNKTYIANNFRRLSRQASLPSVYQGENGNPQKGIPVGSAPPPVGFNSSQATHIQTGRSTHTGKSRTIVMLATMQILSMQAVDEIFIFLFFTFRNSTPSAIIIFTGAYDPIKNISWNRTEPTRRNHVLCSRLSNV